MKYFAYGSNLSLARLRERAPGARRLGSYQLAAHALRFHKVGVDGSGKCDAYHTAGADDLIHGAVFEISREDKSALDLAEGLGQGYNEKTVSVRDSLGASVRAVTYYATTIDAQLRPYDWYKRHVLLGAEECGLPEAYIQSIEAIVCLDDPDRERDARQRAIHGGRTFEGEQAMNLNQVTLPVKDMEAAAKFYRTLGFTQIVDTPHYARFECPEGGSTFSLSLEGRDFVNGAVIYFEHEQLDDWVAELESVGIEFEQPPADASYLWREAVLKDPSGNRIKLYRAGRNRRFPPWRVEKRD